ncbi:hypothetical protein HMPREF9306_01333 [Propionimicrobium lymphophilum ACS-093-V-SCH5]|uniref:YetF C-terminal domain-containing protein n=1 Tax=Propionimicrobium lymphophilum ACS-093-V-SCH5 TaxID=883161 RepID=S2WXZ7_9ACTN|nr:YetF domain-containing protein [Propionimicrobium lymphophilum]EPD32634.1 hypothetical protein HMPREF9306_01333 [Propionimicrobium lymphophilum ACS-093-V-SCH5]
MSFWEQFWHQVGISPAQLLGVAVATVVIYLAITALLYTLGQRFYANRRSSGLVVTLVLGSISARAMLGNAPTLFGWMVALTIVIIMESIFGVRHLLGFRRRARRAEIIYANGEPVDRTMRRYHITPSQLRSNLREKGIHDLSEVNFILLEPSGHLSVVKGDLDDSLKVDIRDDEGLIN